MMSTTFAVIALAISCIAVVFASYGIMYARRCYEYTYTKNVRSVSLARLTELQTEMTEVTDSIVAIQKSLKTLRGRMQARSLNSERANAPVDDEEWRRKTNARLLGK